MFRFHTVAAALLACTFSLVLSAPARAQFFLESATTIQPRHGYLDMSYVRAPAIGGPAAHRFGNALLRLPVTGRLEGRVGIGSLVLKSGDVSAEGTGFGLKTWLVRPEVSGRPSVSLTATMPLDSVRAGAGFHDPSAIVAVSGSPVGTLSAAAYLGGRGIPAAGRRRGMLFGFGASVEPARRVIVGVDWQGEAALDERPVHTPDIGVFYDVGVGLAYVWAARTLRDGPASFGVGMIRLWGR